GDTRHEESPSRPGGGGPARAPLGCRETDESDDLILSTLSANSITTLIPPPGMSVSSLVRAGASCLPAAPTRRTSPGCGWWPSFASSGCELMAVGSVSGCPLFAGLANRPRRLEAEAFDLLAVQADLHDVGPEQQGKGPVDHDAQPAAPTRHLLQVIGAPDEPRREAADPHPEELAERLAVAQRAHHPHGVVDERLRRPAVDHP